MNNLQQRGRTRTGWRWLLPVVAVAAFLTVLVFLLSDAHVRRGLVSVLEWAKGLGPWGPAAVVGFYVVSCVFLLPGSVLTLGAGFLFGLWKGTIVVWIGANLGASAAFLIGRTLARRWVARKVAGDARFRAIDQAVGKEGFKIVLLTRLSPVFPFNLLNYAYGVTDVFFRRYVLASAIGMLPGTVMYVYLGAAAGSLTQIAAGGVKGGAAQHVLLWAGLALTVAVAVVVTRTARRALREAVAEEVSDGDR
jgi:uncharacterized membrane protein YdjX (TVP38/TMEM64 family)